MARRKGFLAGLMSSLIGGAVKGAAAPSLREASSRSSMRVRLDAVVPLASPPGWPVLPDAPDGLDGRYAEDDVPVDARRYVRTTCPSCDVELVPVPKAKKRCPDCGKDIFVRSGLGGTRHLLSDADIASFQIAQDEAAAARSDRTATEWRERLRLAGFRIGDEELDVVGESHRHAALAGIRAAMTSDPRQFEVRVAALIQREPDNKYDRNAVMVAIHGQHVGYLDRDTAANYQPMLRREGGPIYVQALLLGGRPDGRYVGPIGVRLVDVPEP